MLPRLASLRTKTVEKNPFAIDWSMVNKSKESVMNIEKTTSQEEAKNRTDLETEAELACEKAREARGHLKDNASLSYINWRTVRDALALAKKEAIEYAGNTKGRAYSERLNRWAKEADCEDLDDVDRNACYFWHGHDREITGWRNKYISAHDREAWNHPATVTRHFKSDKNKLKMWLPTLPDEHRFRKYEDEDFVTDAEEIWGEFKASGYEKPKTEKMTVAELETWLESNAKEAADALFKFLGAAKAAVVAKLLTRKNIVAIQVELAKLCTEPEDKEKPKTTPGQKTYDEPQPSKKRSKKSQ